MAELKRFFGFTLMELQEMDIWTLDQYAQSKNAIEARELRQQLMVADWPHYKYSDRRKISEDLKKQANPNQDFGAKRLLTHEEIKQSLGALLNG